MTPQEKIDLKAEIATLLVVGLQGATGVEKIRESIFKVIDNIDGGGDGGGGGVSTIEIPEGKLIPDALGNILLDLIFKGEWKEGQKIKGTYWTANGQMWEVLQDFTSNVAPTQNNAYWKGALALTASDPDKADKDLTINTRTSSYTLALTDRAGEVEMNMSNANTLTIPPNSAVAFPVGTQIIVSQGGAGQTTILPGSGVSVLSDENARKIKGINCAVTLRKKAANIWHLWGNLVQ